MANRSEKTPVPAERLLTVRRQIIDYLHGEPATAGMLSAEVGLPEKQVQEHLESLRRQVRLVITPARCGHCGFTFRDRRRTRKPGKCPRCRSTYIDEPLYSIAAD